MIPFSSIIMLLRMLAKPLPPSRWPIFALIEPLPGTVKSVTVKNKEGRNNQHQHKSLHAKGLSGNKASYRSSFTYM